MLYIFKIILDKKTRFEGKGKVIGGLQKGYRTLQLLTKFTKLKKPTILHHLNTLMEQDFVKFDKKTRLYEISINEELENTILKILVGEKTLDELCDDLKSISKKNSNSILKKIILSKNFKNTIQYLIDEILRHQGLAERAHWPMEEASRKWRSSILALDKLGICTICHKEITNEDGVAVAQNIVTREDVPATSSFSPLMHAWCAGAEMFRGGIYSNYGICNYCGLPLSKSLLKEIVNEQYVGLVIGPEEEIDKISKNTLSLFDDDYNRIYSEIEMFPGYYIPIDMYGERRIFDPVDQSFVHVKDGKKYHPKCFDRFHKIQEKNGEGLNEV